MNYKNLLLAAVGLCGIAACSPAPQAEANASAPQPDPAPSAVRQLEEEPMQSKILVAYFSHSGNTAAVARQIADKTGAVLYEIRPQTAYPNEYSQLLDQAKEEIRSGFLPPLQPPLPDISGYDIVFLGSPNWWGTYAPAAGAFLAQYDWSGKTVVPFFTHGGGGMQSCSRDMQKKLRQANLGPAAAFRGRSGGADEKELEKWLAKIGL